MDEEDAAKAEAEKEAHAAELTQLFDKYDLDGGGSLDKAEVKGLLQAQGLCVTDDYIDGIIAAFDADGSGEIDKEEFAKLAQAVIKKSVDAKNDVESYWFWLGLKYRYKDAEGVESEPLAIEAVRELIASGDITDDLQFQVQDPSGSWENWGLLSEFKEFYDEGFANALLPAGGAGGGGAGGGGADISVEEAAKLFDQYDVDGGGSLDHAEVKELLAGAGFDVDEGYINGLLDAFDADGSGDIDRDEFQLLFAALIGRGIGDDTSETNNTDSPWFWMALRYKTKDADGAESEAMPVRVLQEKFESGEVGDESPLKVQDPKAGDWQDWATFGEYRYAYDGFATAVGAAAMEEPESQDTDAVKFWHGLKYRYKMSLEDETAEDFVFGGLRQKVLHGHINDSTLLSVQDPEGNWGEWLTIAEQKGVYDGFETAIGRQIADDTLAQYKQAFNLFDADGGGSIDVDELGTLMKSLGQEADEAELTRLIQMADADGNGDIDFDEFLAIMTSKLHGQEGALEAAKQGYWALQSYKFKNDDAPSSEWLCIAELQDLIASDVITEETALFTERFDSFMPLSKVSEDHPDFEGAISSDYYQSMIYVNDAQEESEEIDAEAIRTAVRSGELVDTNMCWAPGMDNWSTLGDARAKFGLSEIMEDPATIGISGDPVEEGVEKLRDIFHKLDADGSGNLDNEEVQQCLVQMGKGASPEEVDKAMEEMDDDKSGEVALDEFEAWYKQQEAGALAMQIAQQLKGVAKPRVHHEKKDREKKEKVVKLESAAIKLARVASYSGLLCREEAGNTMAKRGGEDPLAHLREVFHSLDADNSGNLDKGEVQQALERIGKVVTAEEVDRAMADMDDDNSGEVGLEEFEAWYKKQEASVGPPTKMTKMTKYYFVVVSLNPDGNVLVKPAEGASGPRALVLYTDKYAMKPLGTILSPDSGLFEMMHPSLSIKLAMRYPHFFGMLDRDGASHIMAAKDHADQQSWVALMETGENTFASQTAEDHGSELEKIFKYIDADGGGSLDKGEVGQLLQRVGQRLDDAGLDAALSEMDGDGTGEIELPEFEAWWGLQPQATRSLLQYKYFSFSQILEAVQHPFSPFNWVLALPGAAEPTVFKAGNGSLKQMSDWLAPGQVLYGLVRVGFGTGEYRQSKLVFVHWSGEETPATDRSGHDALEEEMRGLLQPNHVVISSSSTAEMETAAVLAKICESEAGGSFTEEAFQAATEEERRAVHEALGLKMPGAAKKSDGAAAAAAADTDGGGDGGGAESDSDLGSDQDSGSDSDDDFDSDDDDEYERKRTLPALGAETTDVRLVVDIGYGSTAFGVAGEDSPTLLPNIIREGKDYRYMIQRQKLDAMAVDWEALETQFYQMLETELEVEGERCKLLATISPYASKAYAETLGELMFETFDMPGLYFTNPSILTLYASGKMTGTVVDSGECITSAFPVYEGTINKHAVKSIPFGGRDITDYIKKQLALEPDHEINMSHYGQNQVFRRMKQELCYCGEPRDVPETEYKLPDGETICVSDVEETFPFRAPEFFFFDPGRLDWDEDSTGISEESVQQMIFKSLMDCSIDTRKKLTENIILCGSNTLFDGLPEMMYKKLKTEGKARAGTLKVNAADKRGTSAWSGGCVIASMPNFADEMITIDDYEEEGPESVHRHNLLQDDSGA